ncbi:MAG TPA: DUF1646 family protein [Candidatus Binataceae bacterium]|nr:DUF1646 family protein [Candidatus Binataceae bacterium]
MNTTVAAAILLALLLGPLILAPLEHNLEPYCFALGLLAVTVTGQWGWQLLGQAVRDPLPITITVMAAGLLFGLLRHTLDSGFTRMRQLMPRPTLTAFAVVVIGLVSSLITAIIAALILVEGVGLMGLGPAQRTRVVVLGCFAIGLGSALTPIGGPLATLAAAAMNLSFGGLFGLLAPWVLPGIAAIGVLTAYLTRGDYDLIGAGDAIVERPLDALLQGVRIFAFISGLILIGTACSPIASRYLGTLSNGALYWANIVSAALDNSTLVAIEFHRIEPARARIALISLLVSGGMLIPGNVPNIVCAGKLRMSTGEWSRVGVPLGLVMLSIYFGFLWLL